MLEAGSGTYSKNTTRLLIAALWIVCIIRGFMYASINPAFEGYDEPAHYSYIQELHEHQRLPTFFVSKFSQELDEAFSCLPVYHAPAPRADHESYWTLTPEAREEMRHGLDNIPQEHRKKDSSIDQYQAQHPPLYYLLCSIIYGWMYDHGIVDILFAIRFFSVLLASLTIPLGYLALRKWFPAHPRLAMVSMVIITFMPVFYFDTARVGNDSLGVPLFTGIILAAGLFWKGEWNLTRSFCLGLLLGFGLLTKAYFLSTLPPILILFLFKAYKERIGTRALLLQAFVLGAAAAGIAGWWYWRNYSLYHVFSGLVESVRTHTAGETYSLLDMNFFRFLKRTTMSHLWVGNSAMLDLPEFVEKLFFFVVVICVISFFIKTVRFYVKAKQEDRDPTRAMVGLFFLTFIAAMFYHGLQAFQSTGHYMTSGWYLCAVIVLEVPILLLGMNYFLPGPVKKWRIEILVLGFFILVDFFGLFFRLIPYYSGFAVKGEHHGMVFKPLPSSFTEYLNTVFDRLAVNKPPWMTPALLLILVSACMAASLLAVILFSRAKPRTSVDPGAEPGKSLFSGNGKFAALLFLTALVQGIIWAGITPSWQAPDEPAHFGYVQHLSENKTWRPPGAQGTLSREVTESIRLLKGDRIKQNEYASFKFSPEEEAEATQALKEMSSVERLEPGGRYNSASHYPPLYYLAGTLGYQYYYQEDIVHRIFGVRLISILLSSLTVLVGFFIARTFFGHDTLCTRTASCLLLFHPMQAFIGSSVNCDPLVCLISAVMILLCLLMIKHGPSLRLHVGICACIGLGILSKPTFVAIIPFWFLALLIAGLRKETRKRDNWLTLVVIVGGSLLAGFFFMRFGDQHLQHWLSAFEAGDQNNPQSFLQYIGITFLAFLQPWTLLGKRVITSAWANFGWLDTSFAFYGIYLAAYLLVVASLVYILIRIKRSREPWHQGRNGLMTFAALGSLGFFLCIVVMGYAIAHTAWTSGELSGNLQGRYFFPALPVILLLVTTGLVYLTRNPRRKKQLAYGLTGAMLLWHLASYTLVFQRYYL